MSDSKSEPDNVMPDSSIGQCITQRKTCKVILPVEFREEQQKHWTQEHQTILMKLLSCAANAPFHKKAHEQHTGGELCSPMPWRFHVVGSERCTELLAYFKQQHETPDADPKWARAWQSKIKELLSGCGVLIQATWLPDPLPAGTVPSGETPVSFDDKNIEHVAAAGSAVQSLLIAAQSYGWSSYWSSGGILRDADIFQHLGIDTKERLLGSIFLTPEPHPSARLIDGGLRDQRGDMSGWVRWA